MVAAKVDLKDDYSIEIGANWDVSFELCGADDLTLYTGKCQINSQAAIVNPQVIIINKNTFRLFLNWSEYPVNLVPATYDYDVLFYKTNSRFFAIQGKVTIVERITTVV